MSFSATSLLLNDYNGVLHLGLVSEELIDKASAVITARIDGLVHTVFHLLHFQFAVFVLLHRRVVYALTLGAYLVAKCDSIQSSIVQLLVQCNIR